MDCSSEAESNKSGAFAHFDCCNRNLIVKPEKVLQSIDSSVGLKRCLEKVDLRIGQLFRMPITIESAFSN